MCIYMHLWGLVRYGAHTSVKVSRKTVLDAVPSVCALVVDLECDRSMYMFMYAAFMLVDLNCDRLAFMCVWLLCYI